MQKIYIYDGNLGVIEGNWYEVVHIDSIPKELEHVLTVLFCQINDGGVYNYTFSCEKMKTGDYIWDYFYTEKELRKKKLMILP